MEKKNYSKPFMMSEKFVPQDYVAACPPDSEFVKYLFVCDANTDNPPSSGQYDVYLETNGTAGLQIGLGWGIFGDEKLNRTGIISLSHYHPCNQTHEVTVPKSQATAANLNNLFPLGYIVHPNATDINDRDYRTVRIWTANNTNIHCTRQLNQSNFTIKNPS